MENEKKKWIWQHGNASPETAIPENIKPLLRPKSEPKRSAGILDIPFALDRAGNVVSIEFLIHRDFCWNAFLSGKNRLDRQAVLDAVILGACFNYTPEELEIWVIDQYGSALADKYENTNIPHLKVLKDDPGDSFSAYRTVKDEIDRRYSLWQKEGTGYLKYSNENSKKNGKAKSSGSFPHILFVFDGLDRYNEILTIMRYKAYAIGAHCLVSNSRNLEHTFQQDLLYEHFVTRLSTQNDSDNQYFSKEDLTCLNSGELRMAHIFEFEANDYKILSVPFISREDILAVDEYFKTRKKERAFRKRFIRRSNEDKR